ncbi:MAG: hypothetical protein R8K53_04960 [Mariprofundaceae bacterium]
MAKDIEEYLKQRKVARLIPSLADSKKEERATSVLLATFMIVPDFAQAVLADAGARISSSAKIKCFTEVCFDLKEAANLRPDGLIVVRNRGKVWSALVEAKIGNAEHNVEQIENYLTLAKQIGADAVITLSNQFAMLPTHHPVKVSGQKLRSVDLYHFSWLSIISKGFLLYANDGIEDREQDYVLRELAYYLEDPSSGVSSNVMMRAGWADVCDMVRQQSPLRAAMPEIEDAVSSWQQAIRFLSIQLSKEIESPVNIHLTRARAQDPQANFKADVANIIDKHQLDVFFRVPDAASLIRVDANFHSRKVMFSMALAAPKDKSRATASINWLTRQLRDRDMSGVRVIAHWPRRSNSTCCDFQDIVEDPALLVLEGCKELPTEFEIIKDLELGGTFKARRKFADEVSKGLLGFYEQVGQWLCAWVPKAPRVPKADESNEAEVHAD